MHGKRQSVSERVQPAVAAVELSYAQRFDRGLDVGELNEQDDPARTACPKATWPGLRRLRQCDCRLGPGVAGST